jgi:hypothetical protein
MRAYSFAAFLVITYTQTLTDKCTQSLFSFADAVQSPSCKNAFKVTISDPFPCLDAAGYDKSINCLDINTVIAANLRYDPQANPPRPIQNASTCPLCSTTAQSISLSPVNSSCLSLLRSASEAAFGFLLSDSYPNASMSDLNVAVDMVSANCSNMMDSILLASLRYQSQVVCASSSSFGYPITPIGTLDGVLDMRNLFQCGTCGMMQCIGGMYCPGHSPATICSSGYYCPNPAVLNQYTI